MRTLIIGAGAVGQYLGARLVQGGHDVVLFAREPQAAALTAQGITLFVDRKASRCSVKSASDPNDDALKEPFELVIVAVKSYSTAEAVGTLHGVQSSSAAAILTVQNGVGNEETLAEAFGEERTIAGALTVAVDRTNTTSITATSRGGLCIAPLGANPHNWILAAFGPTGLPVRAVADWRSLKWSKLCINILGNGVCAALDWLPAQVYADRTAFAIERACLVETIAVMSALGIVPINLINFPAAILVQSAKALPASVLRVVLGSRVARARGDKLPSLLQDLRAHRPHSEVSALNGAVALCAVKNGMHAPANMKVAEVVSGIAGGTVTWERYRGKPDTLWQAITTG